jgi:glycerol uptake facilitator-like aquaporin
MKSTVDEIRQRFDADVERFSNLDTGQSATVDAPLVYALSDVSGCHLNPAVTLGFFVARRFEGRLVGPYIVSQLLGAVAASLTLRLMFPTHATLGATLPAGDALQSFVLEVILTLILMFVVLSVSTGSKEKGVLAGVAVGSVIALEALFAGLSAGLR